MYELLLAKCLEQSKFLALSVMNTSRSLRRSPLPQGLKMNEKLRPRLTQSQHGRVAPWRRRSAFCRPLPALVLSPLP